MLTLTNYTTGQEESKAVELPNDVQSVSFSYDGGRVYVSINGNEVFSSHFGGNDCCIELDTKKSGK